MWLVRSKQVQQCVLICVIAFIFYDGIWGGAPRADHLIYLHNMWGQDTLGEVVSGAPTWNRDRGHGDAILFRPLLYLQLGLFYHVFGYEFALWQFASLLLHVGIVLLLHSCFWQTRLSGTFWPLVLALPLAVSQFGAELVLWTHLGGYLLFVLTALASFRFLIGYIRRGRVSYGIASLLSAFAGTFLYETGTLLCFLIAAWLSGRVWMGATADRKQDKNRDRMLAAGFLAAGAVCPIWGATDYVQRYTGPSLDAVGGDSLLASLAWATWYALVQIWYWLAAFLLPTQFEFSAVGRAVAHLSSWWPSDVLQGAVYLAALLIIAGAASVVGTRVLKQNRIFYFSVGLCALFLYGYSWVIAAGRAVPRGLDYVLYNNIYYAHIAYAAIGMLLCTGLFFWHDHLSVEKPGRRSFSRRSLGGGSFVVGLLAVSAVNAEAAATLSSRYRYLFSPDLLEIVHALRDWHESAGKAQSYFVLGPSCRGNETIDWFDPSQIQPGKGWSPPLTFADALFPERSFDLNSRGRAATSAAPDVVDCVADQPNPHDLSGRWRGRRGARYNFAIGADGKLVVTDRSGVTTAVSIADGRVAIPAWGLSGRLTRTGASLLWDDETAWRR